MDETIQIVVTLERFDEVVSIDDSMYWSEMTNKETYDYICQFVSDGKGGYLSPQEARKLFKKVPKKDFHEYVSKFYNLVRDAFVNPTSGKVSEEH